MTTSQPTVTTEMRGWGNAMRYLLTGDELSAEEAWRMGVLQEVAEPGQGLGRALEIAGRIADQAPLAVRECRRSAHLALEQGFAPARAELLGQARALMASEDALEGVRSFLERRAGRFEGK